MEYDGEKHSEQQMRTFPKSIHLLIAFCVFSCTIKASITDILKISSCIFIYSLPRQMGSKLNRMICAGCVNITRLQQCLSGWHHDMSAKLVPKWSYRRNSLRVVFCVQWKREARRVVASIFAVHIAKPFTCSQWQRKSEQTVERICFRCVYILRD